MTVLGDRLKEARKAKGYTLDDLQDITKIQKRYLNGIENEDYSSMPGSFYVRAFIKQYAEAVGLDADEMLALYKDSSSSAEKVEEEQPLAAPNLSRRSTRNTGQLNQVMPKIIAALFIIVILVVLVFLWKHSPAKSPEVDLGTDKPIQVEDQKKPNTDKKPDVVDEDKEDPAKEDDESEESEDQTMQTLEHTSDTGGNSNFTLSNATEFKLEIRTADDSWIGVLDANKAERMPSPGARVMMNGEKVELDVSDTDSVRIRVGRTSSTEIYVNGELLKYETDTVTQNIIIEYKKEE